MLGGSLKSLLLVKRGSSIRRVNYWPYWVKYLKWRMVTPQPAIGLWQASPIATASTAISVAAMPKVIWSAVPLDPPALLTSPIDPIFAGPKARRILPLAITKSEE